MEKRVTFRGWLLPLLLIAPQVVISAVFFFYPAGQAIWQSLFIPDPFGLSSQFVGLGNFEFLLSDKFYRASFLTTAQRWPVFYGSSCSTHGLVSSRGILGIWDMTGTTF